MREALEIIKFCGWFGIMGLCAILIITGILRWLASKADRKRRLNILGWAAFAMLSTILLVYYEIARMQVNENSNGIRFPVFFNVVKDGIGLLAFGLIAFSVIILIFIVALCLWKGVRLLIFAKFDTNEARNRLEEVAKRNSAFITAIRNPFVILMITLGIMALFFAFPFLVGRQDSGGVVDVWEDGIYTINRFIGYDFRKEDDKEADSAVKEEIILKNEEVKKQESNNSDKKFSQRLSVYMIFYIVVLGVVFAIIKIFYSIIDHTLRKHDDSTFIDEYANPIGLLGVGVALLLEISNRSREKEDGYYLKLIGGLIKNFAVVVFIIAIVVLVLEIIRLLMDMKETLIRKEARYLFISLVGQSTLLLSGVLRSVYSGINSISGIGGNLKLERILEKLEGKIIQVMDEEIQSRKKYKITFSGFDEKTTKK